MKSVVTLFRMQRNGGQHRFDRAAMRLVLRRKPQPFAKVLLAFVGGEARRVGRDLEKNPARLTKVNGMEILPVDYRCDVKAGFLDATPQFYLFICVGRSESDVVDRPGAEVTMLFRSIDQIDERRRAAAC